ncbi:hypothetical protein ABZT26_02835 [Streptomyces sp. NPDC005395]|uniref:hypothetical protein n=1 Tax=Streptomyces sp. NPDC005395 TaxID=3157042 RepID=UPI0033AE35AC
MRHLTATRVLIPGVIGPYDAHVNLDTHWNGYARPLFTLDTVRQIATDTQAEADECGSDAMITVHVIDGDPTSRGETRAVVAIVNWQYWDADHGAKHVTDIAVPTEDGLYGLGTWCWEFHEWHCHCGERNQWHIILCPQCDRHRDVQAATPDGMTATRVRIDGGPTFPAFIDSSEQNRLRVTPHFPLDTVRELAAYTQKNTGPDPRSSETIHVLETEPDAAGNRGVIVVHTDWILEVDEGPANAARTVVPDEHDLYPIGDDWDWSVACWWCTKCERDNLWHHHRCSECGLTRKEQPAAALRAAVQEVGQLLRTLAPEATSALVDLTDLARVQAVFAGDTEIDTADDTGPFDTETLGACDTALRRAIDHAVIGDLTEAGWEPVELSQYRITFDPAPAS